jgi:hypothetical protein
MDLLEKYIQETGKHLPRRNRLDLQTEIRSTIEDMLDDRSEKTGKPIDDALTCDVLKEYGAPAEVAAAYQPSRYMIGPQMYPFFSMVVKIVLTVLFAVTIAGFGYSFFTGHPTGEAFLISLGKFALQFLGAAISALGGIVLVFAILERVIPASEFSAKTEEWEPSQLDAEPDPNEVKRGDMIFEILFTVLGLAMLNFFPHLIGIAIPGENGWNYIPVLSDAFLSYLPWINLLGVLSILLDVFLLRQGFWRAVTQGINLFIEIAGIVLAGFMLSGPSLISISAAELSSTPDFGSAATLLRMVQMAPKIILIILIVVKSVEAVLAAVKMIRQRMTPKLLIQKS